MNFLRNLTLIALGLCFALEVSAQTTPALSQLPWFDYRPERIQNDFESIIGMSGTNTVPGTTNQSYYYYHTTNTHISLPFDFSFQRVNYPAGHRIGPSMFGTVTFDPPTNSFNSYYYYYYPVTADRSGYSYDHMNKALFPYWGMYTTSVSNPTGGVYWRVDGPVGDRVLD